jgi:hypothetical protein
MRWEIKTEALPQLGDIRFVTKFAWLPIVVLSKLTMTDHRIWLELYIEEQEYTSRHDGWYGWSGYWKTVARTIHI